MPTSRFAGFDSPAALMSDESLDAAEKLTALYAWRSAIERSSRSTLTLSPRQATLLHEIAQALRAFDRE